MFATGAKSWACFQIDFESWSIAGRESSQLAAAAPDLNAWEMAEGVGFEPTVALRLLLISSQMPLTTQPPFRYVYSMEQNAGFHISQHAVFMRAAHPICPKVNSQDNTEQRWQKITVPKLVRLGQSGIHGRGKLIWNSLPNDRISVAQFRLGGFQRAPPRKRSLTASHYADPRQRVRR